ncbi:MAG: hypothetical protein LAQ69_25930 [Acidobacteriia bacterium]|nr:hypothetical protein [Terriglobia bacterium]
MVALDRLAQLSAPRQALVRLFQSVNFGQIIGLTIRDGDPVFHPEPTVLLDVKLDADEGERPEADLADFMLRGEVRRLFAHLDQLQNGTVERIEVRSGVPRRVIIERRLTEAVR